MDPSGASVQYLELLEALLRDAPVGIALIDSGLRYAQVNETLAATNGLSVEEHRGRRVSDVVSESWPAVEPLLQRALAGETLAGLDQIAARPGPSGEERRWLASYYPIRQQDRVVAIGYVAYDVTQLRAAEDSLRVRTDMYSMLARTNRAVSLCSSPDELFREVCEIAVTAGRFRFAWMGVPDGGTVRPVASAGVDNGYIDDVRRSNLMVSLDPGDPRSRGPTGQALLRGVRSVVHDFAGSPMTEPWREALRRAGLRSSAAFPLRERGHVVAVLTLYAATERFFTPGLVDALGEIAPALSSALDRFALERDRAVREADLLLRDRALRAATQGVVITDARAFDNPVIYVSPSFELLTGYTSAEIVGRNCRMLQGPETDPAAVAEVRGAIAAGAPCTVELLNYRRDGATFYNNLSISPILDDSGAISHFVGVQTDVTERRELERQLSQAQKMEAVGQLAGGVSHDFNNMLTVIRGAVGVALSDTADAGLREALGQIDAAAEHAASLTGQLLALSRRQVLRPRATDLNRIVAEIEGLVLPVLGPDVELRTELAPGLPHAFVDPDQLRRVILNLAINARDAMPGGGVLEIRTEDHVIDEEPAAGNVEAQAGLHVVLELSDTGIGMDAETVGRVFDPFFTTKADGTGLGLATVYGIVKQSGGHVSVSSRPGEGTSFRIHLPATDSPPSPEPADSPPPAPEPSGAQPPAAVPGGAQPSPEPADSPPSPERSGAPPPPPEPSGTQPPAAVPGGDCGEARSLRGSETVLYVDDSEQLRPVVERMLRRYGYTVVTAAGAAEALELDARHPGQIDLLISDTVMPGLSGLELARALRARHPGLKVLLTSGYPTDAIVDWPAVEIELEFIAKPFVGADLASKVRDLLDG